MLEATGLEVQSVVRGVWMVSPSPVAWRSSWDSLPGDGATSDETNCPAFLEPGDLDVRCTICELKVLKQWRGTDTSL